MLPGESGCNEAVNYRLGKVTKRKVKHERRCAMYTLRVLALRRDDVRRFLGHRKRQYGPVTPSRLFPLAAAVPSRRVCRSQPVSDIQARRQRVCSSDLSPPQ